MLDIKSQSQLAETTTEMMRACAFATARAASTFMFQGMSFWSRMIHSAAASSAPAFPATWSRACIPQADAQVEETPPQASAEPPADTAFASYRSSGGHAVAQVIVS